MDIRQMIMQMAAGKLQSNPMMQQVMQMKQQGMTAQQAMQQLSRQYPQFQQYQGMNPAQLDQMAMGTIQSVGLDPNAVTEQIKKLF